MIVKVEIDYSNNSESWWDNGGEDLWDMYEYTKDEYNRLVLPEEVAEDFYKKASAIDGWDNPDAPVFARFPVQFLNEDGEEIWYEDGKFSACDA